MPIPDYQTIMLPLLQQLADGRQHVLRDLVEILGRQFSLTEQEMNEMLSSGQDTRFRNRVGWARTYMKKAGLVYYPQRGVVVITERGLDVLKHNPDRIDNNLLKQFPEFLEFLQSRSDSDATKVEMDSTLKETRTPEEIIDEAYLSIRQSLAQELLDTVQSMSPAFFEKLVVELLVKMGYGGSIKDAGKAMGKTGDEGIDGTIKEDKLGLDIIYIQAKRWQTGNTVGRPELQKFVGALAGQAAKKGIFITTSSFSKEALGYSPKNETKIVLIDGVQLAQLMIDYNLGASQLRTYEIKRLDNDYFEEG